MRRHAVTPPDMAREIGERYARGESVDAIAKALKISRARVTYRAKKWNGKLRSRSKAAELQRRRT